MKVDTAGTATGQRTGSRWVRQLDVGAWTKTTSARVHRRRQCGSTRLFQKLRKWLKQGDWLEVVVELAKLAKDLPTGHEVWTELSYLDKHGEAGHLDYARFRRRGVPLGSGAIESAIRRVVNLRLKGNSLTWYKENAEGMLMLRCLVLSNRWDDTFAQISTSMASDRYLDGSFRSPDMTAQLKANIAIEPPTPQVPKDSMGYAAAA